MPRPPKPLIATVLSCLVLLLSACGGGGTSSSGSSTSTSGASTSADESPTTTTGSEATFPTTVNADNGEVTIDAQPVAIVSLSPSITEMIYAVGAGDQVVAVDGSSNFPSGTPTTDLSGFRPNVEAIGALEPDLVFLARDRDDVVETLETVGITVVLMEAADDLDEVYAQIRTVGTATGHSAAADDLVDQMTGEVEELLLGVPERGEPLTYFYELSGEYGTVTSDTFVGSVLGMAGLTSIADGVDPIAGQYPRLNAEHVLDADPDVIFLAHSDGSVPTDDELASRPGWSGLTAVANGGVVRLDPDIASRWGPRVVDLLATVIEATSNIDRG